MKFGWLTLCCMLWMFHHSYAQLNPTLRNKYIVLSADSTVFDTLPVIPGSVRVSGSAEFVDYKIDYANATFINLRIPAFTRVQLYYHVASIDLRKKVQHKSTDIIQPEFSEIRNPFLFTPKSGNTELFSRDGLKMNGSLSRGVAFGNNQDLVLNANLNLQLAGKLANDIDVLAAISDENNPIQPEGNTQQLQDFDRVFIQLSKDRTKIVVGDFEMQRPDKSYFMNYYKKSRGAQLQSSFDVGKKAIMHMQAEGAVSRGRFARNTINGIEGNQGPYRLTGTNGETFIIIISGTEAVYLDGEKLTRGEQNDYVIDYNTGEISFMPKRIITQYSRIVVEFQFADRNFARSVFHLRSAYERKGLTLHANYFTEQDHKDQPFLQNLTDSNKVILASVGDRLNEALAPNEIATRTFSNTKILYRKIDTLGFRNVFLFATDASTDSVFYEVKFSFVGAGKGNYILAQSAANGRVFQWVVPANGIPQGDYEPVTLLVSPKRLQMYTTGLTWEVNDKTKIAIEAARSQYDKNLFSNLDKADDGGNALNAHASHRIQLGAKWQLKLESDYEFVDRNFRYVERYRNVEFDRTWNRILTNQNTQDTGFTEHIVSAKTSLLNPNVGNFSYQAGYYNREKAFKGWQHAANTTLQLLTYQLTSDWEYLATQNNSTLAAVNNEVLRFKVDGGRAIFKQFVGVNYASEQSSFTRAGDTLLNGSFAFTQVGAYLRNTDSATTSYRLEYNEREDFQPRNNELRITTKARTAAGNISFMQQNANRLSAAVTYREFDVLDTSFLALQPERTILSRVEYDYSFYKRVFVANTYYQIGSGNELRRDFQYLEVQPGQGQYVWRDFNDDGLQTLNEFLLASSADRIQANYIKVFLPTNSTIRVNNNQFNQTLNINPSAIWYQAKGFKKFLAKWNNQTAFRLDRKTTDLELQRFLNPFVFDLNDSLLISSASLIRNTLFFNRSDPNFGFDLNYSDNRSKNFLTNGFDNRSRVEQGANLRWNFTPEWGITLAYTNGNRSYQSDFFTENNYRYTFYEFKPKITWQVSQHIRVSALAGYFEGNANTLTIPVMGVNKELGGEARYAMAKNGVIQLRYSYYQVQFNGTISSPLGYDMMQGFVVGNNQVWNINFQQRLGGNIQLSFNYDGRQAEQQNTIHIGRVEARYLF